jgi:hypothetical protein
MATPHAEFQDFLTAPGIQRLSSLGLVRRLDELSRATGAHLTVAASG